MSADSNRAGIMTALGTIAGIASNLDYLPVNVEAPALYTVQDREEYPLTAGLGVTVRYFDCWLLVLWQDNAMAEQQLSTLIPAVRAAIKADPTLGGQNVIAQVESAVFGFATISKVQYRAVQYTIRVKETG